jgi:hypothetical protein
MDWRQSHRADKTSAINAVLYEKRYLLFEAQRADDSEERWSFERDLFRPSETATDLQ